MHAITEPLALLWCCWQRPTGATLLCRVGRWDRDHLHAGPFRLAVQDTEELTPPNIMRGFRQSCSGNTLNIERFMRNHAIVTDELACDLMMKVAALVGDMQVLFGETLHRGDYSLSACAPPRAASA
jgi:hypothetical protein